MNKKIKKTLKWTGIIVGAGLGGALIASPEFRGVVMEKAMTGFKAVKGMFTEDTKEEPAQDPVSEPTPKREGRNGGYYKPRYNNKKN
jgi:hypothetical protein